MAPLPEAVRCPDCGTELPSDPEVRGLCPQCLLSLALGASSSDGDALATLDRPSPGRVLGDRYQVREILGRGGMGEVFRAFDLKLRVEVALKAVRAEKVESERAREMLRGEVRSAREVLSPNVCRIFDLVEEDGQELVSMEYVDGTTLGEMLKERGPLALQEAREVASQFLSGLEAIHQAGLVHRDFKPENVMLTRAGRVVVMDFGLAKARTERGTGTIAGTPAYMAPEQARGEAVDARADVYSAGVVLAEMLSVGGAGSTEARQALWRAVRQLPPAVPDGPWAPVLRQALAANPEDRLGSARALAHALEEATQRLPGFETKRPYPGLASFTEEDAEFFFGREAEVEAVWKKLKRPRMLALIAPSGAGKSSFLRAGLLPTLPKGWKALIATPGNRPFQALAHALAPAFAGDAQAFQALLRFEEADTAVSLLQRFRQRHEQALVVLDQFEELFTLSPPAVQEAFSGLLGRLVLEADLHVILSLRDDFLFRCQDHAALVPAFSDLTPLPALGSSALRRALVQPALACGYRFEDEALVDEMLAEVRKEKGALPLIAFAASRLWEARDREKGLLTREAYQEIGGVAGALAQHGDATLERIGTQRTPLVREIFRNLVTAQGTRAVREREELLSAFGSSGSPAAGTAGPDATGAGSGAGSKPDTDVSADGVRSEARTWTRGQADEVLNALVDARLLTSYERAGDGGESHQEVEIIHESLLQAWPRLVRWQTQDADGAQLRDQLRQAAQLWNERGRTDDLLWSGQAYRDFAVWRERYPAPLAAGEESFARATEAHATRRRRRRRAAGAALVSAAAIVAIITSVLWQRADSSRRRAEAQTRQREAAELLALGRLRLDEHPTGALAHAIASLERADNTPARRFAMEALWRGPTLHVLEAAAGPTSVAWSSDGRWLALGGPGGIAVLDRDTGTRRLLTSLGQGPVGFSNDGTRLLTRQAGAAPILHLWAVPEGKLLESWPAVPGRAPVLFDRRLLTFDFGEETKDKRRTAIVQERSIDGGTERTLGHWETHGLIDFGLDPGGEWVISLQDGRLLRQRLDALDGPPRVLGPAEGDTSVWHEWADRIVTSDASGRVRLWSTISGRVERTLRSPAGADHVALDPRGRFLATAPGGGPLPPRSFLLFDLESPRAAEPALLVQKERDWLSSMAFHPHGQWLASGQSGTLLLWNLAAKRSLALRGQKGVNIAVAFAPDGRLVSTSDEDVVRIWRLSPEANEPMHVLLSEKQQALAPPARLGAHLDVDAGGRFAVVVKRFRGEWVVVPLDGSPARVYRAARGRGNPVLEAPRIDPAGQRIASSYFELGNLDQGSIRVLDLATGEERALRPSTTAETCVGLVAQYRAPGSSVWLPDGRLVTDGATGLRVWDVADGSSRQVRPCRPGYSGEAAIRSTPDSRAVVALVFRPGPASTGSASDLSVTDLATGASRGIASHGGRLQSFTLDPTGTTLVSGDADGLVRVGPLSGEGEPHLLYGHSRSVTSVAVSPDGRWIASGSDDDTIRLWPMPEGPPLHTLPYDALLAKLRSLTNLRVVPDAASATGYKLEPGPFPGWAKPPEW